MQKSEVKVLVVEDDITFGKGLAEAFKRSGFGVMQTARPDEALSLSQMQVFHAFVIDCLLPKTSGVDLARQLRTKIGDEVPIILTSGIYRDKAFAKEAILKTKAQAFYEKPFDIQILIQLIEKSLDDLIDESLDPFLDLLLKPNATPGERVKALPQSLHAHELPRVLSYFLSPSVNGQLTLNDGSESSVIGFQKGRIVQVQVKDPESFFGALLVEKNFLSAEELELALSSPGKKRLGEKLVDMNLLSPHVINIINAEQMAIRLSKLIKDTTYEVEFKAGEADIGEDFIDERLLYSFLSDWVRSKIPLKWLKIFYLPITENTILKTPHYNSEHPIWSHPPLHHFKKEFISRLENSTLVQLTSEFATNEEALFGAIHLLVLTQQIAFNRTVKAADNTSQLHRLKHIRDDMQTKNHFEVLGVTKRSRAQDVKKTYHELAKVFHPDKISANTPKEIAELNREIFAKMTLAYETLSDDTRREKYLKEMEQGKAEKILQSESLFEEGKSALKASQFKKALEKFRAAMDLRPPTADLILHSLWARMMTLSTAPDQQKELLDVEQGLSKIAPEDRHSSMYYFVKGLFQKFLGEPDLARRNLELALSLTPSFVEVQRELNVLKSTAKNKPVDIFRDDLSDVITSIFKKKR